MIKIDRPQCPNPTALSGGNYKHEENKATLMNASSEKCMYCESKITHIDYGDVEHIKPKSQFPELKLEWDNLGYACTRCNREYKKDKYVEDTPYVNPYDEEPSEHILASGSFLLQKQGSERGELTIQDIGLNRPSLIEKRQQKIDEINKSINGCFRTKNETLKENALHELKKEADKDKEYSFSVKSLLTLNNIN